MPGYIYIKRSLFFVCFALLFGLVKGQRVHYDMNKAYTGEVGFGLGASNYYGDLNRHSGFEAVKVSAGAFYRHFFGQRFGAGLHINYAQLGYSDLYNKEDFQRRRNLSFNTEVWAFTLQGDFNFFKFEPGSRKYFFTPYLSLGAGIFHFNPYAYYQDGKYFLQPLGTEGQGSADFPDWQKYNLWALALPVEVGLKYNLNKQWNLFLSASYFFTGTDYLDDVSTTYAGVDAFNSKCTAEQQVAAHLQDRSDAYGAPIGEKYRQRGNPENRDQFILLQVGVTYLFTNYRCPF